MESLVAEYVRGPFTADSALIDVGLDSLAVVRIAVAATPNADQEIDPGELATLRTVGELLDWLRARDGLR